MIAQTVMYYNNVYCSDQARKDTNYCATISNHRKIKLAACLNGDRQLSV